MRIRLESNPNFFVPGWLLSATVQYTEEPDTQEGLVEQCSEVFCEGLRGPGPEVWEALLSGRIPYTVQGGTVTFEYGA